MQRSSTTDLHRLSAWALVVVGLAAVQGCQSAKLTDPAAAVQPLQNQSAWWQQVADPQLNQLMSQAQANNLNTKVALMRLEQASALYGANASELFPSVGIGAGLSKSRSDLIEPVKQNRPDLNARQIQAQLNWQLDVFGAARAKKNASLSQAKAAYYGVHATTLALTYELAQSYYEWQFAHAQLAELTQLLSNLKHSLKLTQALVSEGMASEQSTLNIQAQIHDLEAQVSELQTFKRVTQNKIGVLVGLSPAEFSTVLKPVDQVLWPALDKQPVGVELKQLLDRPDLQAAWLEYEAAGFEAKQAHALQFPQFAAELIWGRQDLTLNGFDVPSAAFSNLALSFAMPLINRGQITANIKAKTAKHTQAALNYQLKVLEALESVDNALESAKQGKLQVARLTKAAKVLERSAAHAEDGYKQGQLSKFEPLAAQRQLIETKLKRLNAKKNQAQAFAAVQVALGGNWRAFEPVTPDSVSMPSPMKVSMGRWTPLGADNQAHEPNTAAASQTLKATSKTLKVTPKAPKVTHKATP